MSPQLLATREFAVIHNHSANQQAQAEQLATNIAHIRTNIAAAARRAGRDPSEITLIAVSKTRPIEQVMMAYQLGITDFGENRVQEALPKITQFHPAGLHWHMIGHLQSNKVGKVAGVFDSVQSVDSLQLAQLLERHAANHAIRLPVLLEVNVTGEESKAGMTADETLSLAPLLVTLPHLAVQGLMTVAPLVANAEDVRPVFRTLCLLRDRLRAQVPSCTWQHLSMGMTDDYIIAIEEGATIVRIGRAIFGNRIYTVDRGNTDES
ncbi:MAG: YggS family pyridoxal phosphate-dependent enzyme [Chloroflexi bacterium]|nr:MAG: YggS family pyridoxal phosphate-dependent enzyme [Chloroflexota bacterium]